MKDRIRIFLWKLLGIKYYEYLKGQHKVYLDDAENTTIGKKTYHNGAFVWQWYGKSSLEIGAYCSIADGVNFILDSGFHQTSEITTFTHFEHLSNPDILIGNETSTDFKNKISIEKSKITIGNDVWIGMNAILLPGTVVGNGVTILAGAVVSGVVPDYAIVGGIPARIIKMKFDDETIKKFKKIAWWDWEIEKAEKNVADFYLPTAAFLEKWMPR